MFTKAFRAVSVSRKIAMLALFIAVSVVANSFLGVDIGSSNKIAFTYLVCFFAGCFMGPVPAFVVGVVGDAIGFLIQPVGVFWFFGVTLGLFGFLSGLIMNGIRTRTAKGLYAKAALTFAVGFLLITCIVNSVVNYFYSYLFIWDGVFKKGFWIYLGGRLGIQSVVYVANVVLSMLLLVPLYRLPLLGERRLGELDEKDEKLL